MANTGIDRIGAELMAFNKEHMASREIEDVPAEPLTSIKKCWCVQFQNFRISEFSDFCFLPIFNGGSASPLPTDLQSARPEKQFGEAMGR